MSFASHVQHGYKSDMPKDFPCCAVGPGFQQAGFQQVQILDVSTTTLEEQRSTEWMRFDSLADCLDCNDSSRTVEGHPAPVRAICIGIRPR